jgi:hypothetical protein
MNAGGSGMVDRKARAELGLARLPEPDFPGCRGRTGSVNLVGWLGMSKELIYDSVFAASALATNAPSYAPSSSPKTPREASKTAPRKPC